MSFLFISYSTLLKKTKKGITMGKLMHVENIFALPLTFNLSEIQPSSIIILILKQKHVIFDRTSYNITFQRIQFNCCDTNM